MSFADMDMCGCEMGCSYCNTDNFNEEEFEKEWKRTTYNKEEFEKDWKNTYKYQPGVEYISLEIKTLSGDSYTIHLYRDEDGLLSDDNIVELMKEKYLALKDEQFYVSFSGASNFFDDSEVEFIYSKEKMGLLPLEISEKIFSKQILLSDENNKFILFYTNTLHVKKENSINTYVHDEANFVCLSK
jgi:hypothetical protein